MELSRIHLAVAYFRRTKTTSCNSYFLCIRYMDRYCKESFWTFLLDWCLGMIIFQKQTEKKISETNNYLFFNTCPVKYILHGPSKMWCTQWGHNLSEVTFVVQCFEKDFNSFSPNVSTTPITAMGCLQCLPLTLRYLINEYTRFTIQCFALSFDKS